VRDVEAEAAAKHHRVEQVELGHAHGWSFTPLRGKVPILRAWQSQPRETVEQAKAWARAGNVGLRTGSNSGVVVLDVDLPDLPSELADLRTPAVQTGSGATHLYCEPPRDPLGCPALLLPSGQRIGEIRGNGGQVVFVGSIHPVTGREYHWVAGRTPNDIALAPVPDWILRPRQARTPRRTLRPRPIEGAGDLLRASRAYAGKVPGAAEGGRHTAAVSLAAHLAGFETTHSGQHLTPDEMLTLLDDWNARNQPPLPEDELRRIVTWFDNRCAGSNGPCHLVRETTPAIEYVRRAREQRSRRLDEQRRRLKEDSR